MTPESPTSTNPAAQTVQSPDRRRFLQQAAMVGAGLILAPSPAWAQAAAGKYGRGRVRSRCYAAKDATGKLSPWEFERRPVGDDDVLIDVKFTSICHSDIHGMKGDWGKQAYPQVPGHEVAGIVAAVGRNVTRFKVGDRAGVGCMVDSCLECASCQHGEEHFCEKGATVWTYGTPEKSSPSGISQGGYANNIVVREHFAIRIPDHISLEEAAPLLCAGITTYAPLMRAAFKIGDKVGVAGIGGLGHMAVKLAASKGAEVYAFTTSADKAKDILTFGAKEVVVVDDAEKLKVLKGRLDYMISTIPQQFDAAPYLAAVKPYGSFTQVGMPNAFEMKLNNLALAVSRVNYNSSLIAGVPETQEMVHYCADNKIVPMIEIIRANQINDAWTKVVNRQARYRFVVDAGTF